MSGLEPGPLVPTHRPTLPPSTALPGRNDTGPPGVIVDHCRPLEVDYDVPTAVICGMYLLFGVVYSLFGYRCFKAVMFLTGFIFGSIIVYLICLQEKLLPPYGNVGVALGAGILFGLITMLVQYVGLFMTGFHTGLFTGAAILAGLEEVRRGPEGVRGAPTGPASNPLTIAGILLGSGLLLAILNLRWRKGLTVAGTAVYGGAIISTSLDYFVEKFAMVYWFWARVVVKNNKSHYNQGNTLFQPCWYSWLILSVWPFVVVIGMVTQWAVTGRGIHHQEMIPSKKARSGGMAGAGGGAGAGAGGGGAQRMVRTREQRAEARQKKYRYLYQVRTAHGDVISQSYIQALQRKVCSPVIDPRGGSSLGLGYGGEVGRCGGSVRGGGGGGMGLVIGGVGCIPGETSTLQSDSTHLTILPAEQAQLAALTESDNNESEDDSDARTGSRGEEDDEYYYGGGGAHSSSEAVLRPVPSTRSDRHERHHSGRQKHSPSVGFGIPRPFR